MPGYQCQFGMPRTPFHQTLCFTLKAHSGWLSRVVEEACDSSFHVMADFNISQLDVLPLVLSLCDILSTLKFEIEDLTGEI